MHIIVTDFNWHWPQYAMAIWYSFSLLLAVSWPKMPKANRFLSITLLLAQIFVLCQGGFF